MATDDKRFKLGRLFKLTFYALLYRPLTGVLIAFAVIYLPNLGIANLLPGEPEEILSWQAIVWGLSTLPFYSIGAIFQAWVAFQLIDGNAQNDRLKSVLIRSPTLYGATFVVALVGTAGILLLVIPGVVWGLACTVVIPAAAIERLGVLKAIKRSIELTRGYLLVILGYGLATYVPITFCVRLLEVAFVGGRFELLDTSPTRPFADTFLTMVNYALSATMYVELLRLRDDEMSRTEAPSLVNQPPSTPQEQS